MDNYIGRMLDNRYEILEVIGIGGMAVVYKARCHRLNRLVAIKILKDEYSQDAEFRRRFHAESQAVAMLSHPNIVSVYDVSHSGDTDYIVMELIDGITLKQYMEQKGRLNWRETLHFATQIAKALEHAHSRGIIHRDIKPHNIMILKDGSVKVADFGIARITSAQSTLTREALGSVHYISPEQARGSRVDKRSDLYSLGVVMYEMLTGRPPFDGESPVAVAIQHINGTPTPPSALTDGIPRGLEQITMHAMTAAIEARYESTTDMLYDLEEFRKNPNVVFDFSAAPQGAAQGGSESRGASRQSAAEQAALRNQSRRQPEHRRAQDRTPEKPKGNRVAVIAGIICIALAVIGVFAFLYNSFLKDVFSGTEEIKVPQLVGKRYEDVADDEAYADWKLTPKWENDAAEYGLIIEQSPEKNTLAKPGAEITLRISLGPETDEPPVMPPLVGGTQESAESQLKGMNFQVQVVHAYDETVEKGRVIATDPAAGMPLSDGQVVILTVSDGPEQTVMPPLVGETQESAEKRLQELNFVPQIRTVNDENVEKGRVISTDPAADVPLRDGQTVTLTVSDGPEEMTLVPPVVGVSLDEAMAALEAAGLEGSPRYQENELPKDTVFFQGIDQDTEVRKGTVVNLLVSEGPEEEPVPTEPAEHEKIIQVPLPQDRAFVTMTVTVAGVKQGDTTELETAPGTVPVTVRGTGMQPVSVFFDGVLSWSDTVDFSSGSGT
ncbi:MAG: Stk1 family PASTA domain-containing Ser/Thr kinase [Oscillospiraceae bacterium]|nr:Stk1 family PASTA domain-containing Ser/Thr kinase [Oscillospiraceae bacterium]